MLSGKIIILYCVGRERESSSKDSIYVKVDKLKTKMEQSYKYVFYNMSENFRWNLKAGILQHTSLHLRITAAPIRDCNLGENVQSRDYEIKLFQTRNLEHEKCTLS